MANMLKGVKKNMQQAEEGRTPTGLLEQQGVAPEKQKIPPKLQRELDVYNTSTMQLIHSQETRGPVVDMLKSAPIEQSVPSTALYINEQLESKMKPSTDVVLANSVTLVSDLLELSEAAGISAVPDEAGIKNIYQDTLQSYIEKGIKGKTIDPVELQKSVEPLMNKEQRAMGMQGANQGSLPGAPTNEMASQKMVEDAVAKEQAKAKEHQGLMQGLAENAVPGKKPQGGGRI